MNEEKILELLIRLVQEQQEVIIEYTINEDKSGE